MNRCPYGSSGVVVALLLGAVLAGCRDSQGWVEKHAALAEAAVPASAPRYPPVSYTHLTLPTSDLV